MERNLWKENNGKKFLKKKNNGNKFLKKKIYCPTCHSKLEFSAKPFEKPKLAETLTAKQKAMAKAEKKKTGKAPAKKKVVKKKEEKEQEEFICPYCGKVLKEKLATCPDCGATLKFWKIREYYIFIYFFKWKYNLSKKTIKNKFKQKNFKQYIIKRNLNNILKNILKKN